MLSNVINKIQNALLKNYKRNTSSYTINTILQNTKAGDKINLKVPKNIFCCIS